MEEDKQQVHDEKSSQVKEEPNQREDPEIEKLTIADSEAPPKNAGGWGWDFSVLSDLQKAAEEISCIDLCGLFHLCDVEAIQRVNRLCLVYLDAEKEDVQISDWPICMDSYDRNCGVYSVLIHRCQHL